MVRDPSRILAITIGDPGGIGPEVSLKAILELKKGGDVRGAGFIPLLIGDRIVIDSVLRLLKSNCYLATKYCKGFIEESLRFINLKDLRWRSNSLEDSLLSGEVTVEEEGIYCLDPEILKGFKKGMATEEGGHASVHYIKIATELAMAKKVHAIVTAPISKRSLNLAGYRWPGHTEMLKDLTGAEDVAMMFFASSVKPFNTDLKLILTTIHVPLREVPQLITEERVFKTILFAKRGALMFGIEDPRIGVSGLNPHASEEGLFGDEEQRAISPAIKRAQLAGIKATGPFPPDVIFYKAVHGEFDIVVSMYHDQGLAPLKLLAFKNAVNITVGLPIIRTSPDHGTAYDIAWKGVADPSSMAEAIKTALRLLPPS